MEHDVGQIYITSGSAAGAMDMHGGSGGGGSTLDARDPLSALSPHNLSREGGAAGGAYHRYSGMDHHSIPIADIRLLAREFLIHFHIVNDFVYLRCLRENLSSGAFFLEIEMSHLQEFSAALGQAVLSSPVSVLPLMEQAVWEVAAERKLLPHSTALVAAATAAVSGSSGGSAGIGGLSTMQHGLSIQVQLFWNVSPTSLRQLAQVSVGKLICVSGIVVKVSASHNRCTRAAIQCTSCRSKTYISGRRGLTLPPQCLQNSGGGGTSSDGRGTFMVGGGGGDGGGGGNRKRCRPNPYVMLPMECQYEDQQVLKIQELPEDVPTGELPRHVTVVLDRYLVDRVSPGSRVHIVGIVSVQEHRSGGGDLQDGKRKSSGSGGGRASTAGLRAQYLRAVGVMFCSTHEMGEASVVSVNQSFSSRVRMTRSVFSWNPEEESQFKAFAKTSHVYEKLSNSIDPAIFGLTNQKKAIVCLLMGGTRKKNGSNYLRGDMNVLFIGDPSTAKSQLLKFTEKVAPIGIYTSGKGSSAAGLTASVVSTGKGDFALEAGSMVLADGGVVCIDEFDKMREQDQVAIHEAMEQQTISIAKANLTTMLNSRTSVLAAANPSLGSYDPLRSNEDQMDFASSILSRFDLIFKVIDPRNAETDRRLAHHVVHLHKTTKAAGGGGGGGGGRKRGAGGEQMSGGRGGGSPSSGGVAPWTRRLPGASSRGSRKIASGEGRDGMGDSNKEDGRNGEEEQEVVDRRFLTKYIAYARATCFPIISEEAMRVLLDFYVQVRRDSHKQNLEALCRSQTLSSFSPGGGYRSGAGSSGSPSSLGATPGAFSSEGGSRNSFSSSSGSNGSATPIIQITARQLESLVRLTESQAKMRLDGLASRKDAEEAIRLFKTATVDAMNSGLLSGVDEGLSQMQSDLVLRVEEAIRRGISVGSTVDHHRLLSEMGRRGFEPKIVDRAIAAMVRREELLWRKQRTLLYRVR